MAYRQASRSSSLTLAIAGAAFVMTAWLVYERLIPTSLWDATSQPRTITPRGELADFEKATISIFEENAASVVYITSPEVRVRTSWGSSAGRVLQEGTGTGFVWNRDGYIVTNYHVISGRSKVRVRMSDLHEYIAAVVNIAPDQDIAVLKLLEMPSSLRPIQIGTSHDLRTGQSVFAIGNPFGLDHTLTTGVISALDRTIESVTKQRINHVIQVDASINPGNSGGPLLDSAGRLIGMNTAIYSPNGASAGIGFAVPIDTINAVVPHLISNEGGLSVTTRRPVLGVECVNLPLDLDTGRVRFQLIRSVVEGSGAASAGLLGMRRDPRTGAMQYGDLILAIDDMPIRAVSDIRQALQDKSFGDSVKVMILRDILGAKREMTVSVTLRPFREPEEMRGR